MFVKIGVTPSAQSYRAFLDGEDVSRDCYEASEEEGYVMLYSRDNDGKKYIVNGQLVTERRTGHVRIQRRDYGQASV